MTEKEEDAKMMEAGQADVSLPIKFLASPSYIEGGKMRDYQARHATW